MLRNSSKGRLGLTEKAGVLRKQIEMTNRTNGARFVFEIGQLHTHTLTLTQTCSGRICNRERPHGMLGSVSRGRSLALIMQIGRSVFANRNVPTVLREDAHAELTLTTLLQRDRNDLQKTGARALIVSGFNSALT